MLYRIATAALCIGLLSASPIATAQTVGIAAPPVFDVRDIAAVNGVISINKLQLDEGVWKIEGRDVDGRYVYMRVDPNTGAIVKMERYW